MLRIVSAMPGFISYKAYTAEDGERVAMVRLASREAVDEWKNHPKHLVAQERARTEFFDHYWIQACETFRSYEWSEENGYTAIHPEVFEKGARTPA